MKIARFSHNKFTHTGVIHHDQLLSTTSNLGVLEILALPKPDRNYLEGQSGRYMKAPLGMYPYASPLEGQELQALKSAGVSIARENVLGSGASVALPSGSADVFGSASIATVASAANEAMGYCLVVSLFIAGHDAPFASVIGPYITTVEDLQDTQPEGLEIKVNGSESNLSKLANGDRIVVSNQGLGQLELTLVAA